MIDHTRRTLVKCAGAIGALAAGVVTGLVKPSNAAAAQWNRAGFESKAMSEALKALGAGNPVESREIAITAPDIAEKNPRPLMATFDVSGSSEGYVSTRIKMGETSNVWAVVKADGKFFAAKKEVKVTVGGCG